MNQEIPNPQEKQAESKLANERIIAASHTLANELNTIDEMQPEARKTFIDRLHQRLKNVPSNSGVLILTALTALEAILNKQD